MAPANSTSALKVCKQLESELHDTREDNKVLARQLQSCKNEMDTLREDVHDLKGEQYHIMMS